ncbi:MAG: peptide ABC transporter substrate-binding protein [Chlamydiia bacterium]|nr:peptide ABC transporter substrate-binding protein [Chlamydiia bacterium]
MSDGNIARMFLDGLTRTDKEGKSQLAVAKKVDISSDQKTYTFTLRDSKWSNGDPVTSHDFAYAWKKSLTPSFLSPNANLLYIIKNAKEAKEGHLPLSLVGIETPDEKTLIVTLSNPTPYFLDIITHPIFFPINNKVARNNSHWAENETTFVGNGPFILSDWKHHNMILAVKNPEYWDSKSVVLSHVKMIMVSDDTGFKMFDTKDINWDGSPFSTIPVDAIESLKASHQLRTVPVLATEWIRVNTDVAPFHSKKMRHALAFAINRQAIVDHVTQGNQIPATGIVPTSMGLTDSPYFEDGNVEAAALLFNEALQEMGTTIQKLPEITLMYASQERNYLIAQAIQNQWREAFGLQVRLEPVEPKVFFDRVSKKNYTLSIGNWFADVNDPINFLEVFKRKDGGTNNTNWENPSYVELLETASHCSDKKERQAVLHRSEEILMSEMPVIPIFHFTMLYVQDNHLKDVVLTTMGSIDFKWAHIDND